MICNQCGGTPWIDGEPCFNCNKTPQDQIRDAAEKHAIEKNPETPHDFPASFTNFVKICRNASERDFVAGSSWMLEAVLRELRGKEGVEFEANYEWNLTSDVWADWLESRFKKLEEGET